MKMSKKWLHSSFKQLASLCMMLACCYVTLQPLVAATPLPANEIWALNNHPTWLAQTSLCSGTSISNATFTLPPGSTNTSGSAWKSNLQPPYIVEQFAIQILEDLAQKKGVDVSNAVTPQHVLALVAWAVIEGGDINNKSLFNLYNSGQRDKDFIAGTHTADGQGSYISFDAGVEETARNIADGKHDGMLAVLLNANSSAEDFAHAESYSQTSAYPGTLIWAEAAYQDPSGYEKNWIQVINNVRANYKKTAAITIGTSDFEELIANDVEPSKLSNISAGGFDLGSITGTPVSASCALSVGNNLPLGDIGDACNPSKSGVVSVQSIVLEAISLSWCDKSHGQDRRPTYIDTLATFNKGFDGIDCGVFVSTVMHATKLDPKYEDVGTGNQWRYVEAHPEKYDVKENITTATESPDNLMPGDILIIGGPNPGGSGLGHTFIYLGSLPGKTGKFSASASYHNRSPNLAPFVVDDLVDSRGKYLRARFRNNVQVL